MHSGKSVAVGVRDKWGRAPSGPIGEEPGVEEPDFRPNIVWYSVLEGTAVKGAVMVCPGGAFMFRSGNEGPFYRQFNQNVEAVRQTGVQVESHVRGEWSTWFDNFLTEVMTNGASGTTNSNKGIRTYLSSHS